MFGESAESVEDDRPEDALQRALDGAYRYLNRRERTVAEVRQRLEQVGIESAIAEEAIAILTEQNVLDDERYARLFVQDKRALEQWGGDRIRRALRTRGIGRDVIEEALTEDESSADELARAVELLRARFPSPPQDRRERDRALGVMLRKGYDAELAIDALAAYARDPTSP
jgi:regulatory protein